MEIAISRFLVWLKLLVAVRPILVKFLPFLSVTANYVSHLWGDNTLDLESFFFPSVQIFISIISFILVTSLSGKGEGWFVIAISQKERLGGDLLWCHKLSFCVCWNSDSRVIVQVTGAENFRVRGVFFQSFRYCQLLFQLLNVKMLLKSVAFCKTYLLWAVGFFPTALLLLPDLTPQRFCIFVVF